MASGIFIEARNSVQTTVEALGYKVVTDARNLRPMTVLMNPPTFDCFNLNIADITFELSILAAPPANQDALDWLLTQCDTIMDSALAITQGRPGSINIGGQDLPCYDLTVRVSARRN